MIAEQYRAIQVAIAGRAQLVAVSKGQPFSAISALYALGQRDFGENYAQELSVKAEQAREAGLTGVRWHFLGHLQRNKAKVVATQAWAIHSLDSFALAQSLDRYRGELGGGGGDGGGAIEAFIEINIDREPQKAGLPPDTGPVAELVRQASALKHLRIAGLMCVPAAASSDTRVAFRALAALRDRVAGATGQSMGMSMGMSGDYVTAIECGATHVRVGTALFGPRPAKLSGSENL